MRLTFIIASLDVGGAQRALTAMLNYWSRQGKYDISLLVLGGKRRPAYTLNPTIAVSWLGLDGNTDGLLEKIVRNVQRISVLRKAISLRRPDVVVSFQDVTNIYSLLACVGLNTPVVCAERIHPEYHHIGTVWSALRKRLYPRAAAIAVQGMSIGDWFGPSLQEKITVIPNSVPDPGCSKNVHKSVENPLALAVGRLHRQKGFDLLLRAFARLHGQHPEWRLRLVGDGPERNSLEELVQNLGIAGLVEFSGETKDVATHMRQASLYVFPSRYEGFPNALVEGMACGLPVVATDSPGCVGEIIQDGENGILVESENVDALTGALSRLMGDVDLRERLAERARGVLVTYSEDRIMSLWDTLIAQAAG